MGNVIGRTILRIGVLLLIFLQGSFLLGGDNSLSIKVGTLLYSEPLIIQSENGYGSGSYAQPIAIIDMKKTLPSMRGYVDIKLGYSYVKTNPHKISPLYLEAKTFVTGLSLGRDYSFKYSKVCIGIGVLYLGYTYDTQFYSIDRASKHVHISPTIETSLRTKISDDISLTVDYGFFYLGEHIQTIEFVANPDYEMIISSGDIANILSIGITYDWGK